VSSALLLLDSSAWARISNPRLSQQRADEIAGWMSKHRLVTCLPFLLEAGYSARSARDHDNLFEVLLELPPLRIDDRVERRAISAQRQLARAGHHRLPPADLILAATADVYGVGVLHYDGDFDVLREKTDLRFESVWLAERGTL
jgi:predicted nucleic acid-binding protein